MNWQSKAIMLQILSRLPGGRSMYRKLQDLKGSTKLDIGAEWPPRLKLFQWMAGQGIHVEGSRVLEIGTGWHPILPVLLYLFGAREVVSLDVNPWLSRRSLAETMSAILTVVHEIPLDICGEDFPKRLGFLEESMPFLDVSDIRTFLAKLGITYLCPVDAAHTGFENFQFDFVIHTDVFEHVPPDSLHQILVESHRLLKEGGIHCARICPGDHFAENGKITTINFLKFHKMAWYWIGGSGLAYHNRLRCAEYVEMFREVGFNVISQLIDVDESAKCAMDTGCIVPNEDFRKFTHEQLAATRIYLLAEKADR